jgi:beta-lactamase class D
MKEYIQRLNYGNMVFDLATIDNFWLEGESAISQFQQIDFLERLYKSKLPITERTEKIVKRIMVMEENNTYKLSGKTGWTVKNGNNIGWWVGFIETKEKVYFFATNIEPKPGLDMERFPELRKQLTITSLNTLGIIKKNGN